MKAAANLNDVLGAGADPAGFWNRFAQALADGWDLEPALMLRVSGPSRIVLLGMSAGADPSAIPPTAQHAAAAAGEGPVQVDAVGRCWLVVPLAHPAGGVVLVAGANHRREEAALHQLKVAGDAILAAFEAMHRASEHEQSLNRLTEVLDLGLIVGEAGHFEKAAIAVCNEVASRFSSTRVTLGWKKHDAIRLVATSHGARVRNDTELAGGLARAMDEALNQDVEVAFPDNAATAINEQHRAYSQARGGCRLLSLPLRHQGRGCGALTLESSLEDAALAQEKVDALRVTLDLVTPHLDELHRRSGWAGARLWRAVRRRAGDFVGYRHTGWKLAGMIFMMLLLLSLVVRIDHKVKAPFILKTTSSAQITAPFAGYIDRVNRQVGDIVEAGEVLVELDRRELLVQRSEYLAERDRNLNEARRHEAEGDLSQARLSQLAARQAEARLEVIDHRLSRAVIRAPFDGIIVEGDLNERLSSPTQVGETLLQVVRLDGIYAELQVDERDITYIRAHMDGRLAFTSRPESRYPVQLDQFEPVAVVEESGTVFRVRVNVLGEPAEWWRPGMSGICRVEIGPRSIAWIVFHRTIEWFRLWFWW